jgi:hypothetical protein
MLGMCYILCMIRPSVFIASGTRGLGGSTPKFVFDIFHPFLVVFRHMVFYDGFLILVKKLGLLNNLGQWIMGFVCCRILYILYCKQ